MISRIYNVIDDDTSMYFLITVFEEVDRPICDKLHINPGFKIVNKIYGRLVESSAGYEFTPDYPISLEGQSRKFISDGTSTAFGMLLSYIDDIKRLPDKIDVQQIMDYWINLHACIFIDEDMLQTIDDHHADSIVKCLYQSYNAHHIALIDISQNQVIYDQGYFYGLERILPQYLWLPVEEAKMEYLNTIDISSILKKIVKPEA